MTKLEVRFLLGALSATLGFLLLPAGKGYVIIPLSSLFFMVAGWLTLPTGAWTRPIRLPKWNAVQFFFKLAFLLGVVLVGVLAARLPAGEFSRLYGDWYFAGLLWLIVLSMLAGRYAEEKRKQRSAGTDSLASESGGRL